MAAATEATITRIAMDSVGTLRRTPRSGTGS